MAHDQPTPQARNNDKLINDIKSGVIKIPKFQRDFVWSLEKTADLLDSIVKGYPIGTFILWQTQERLSEIKNLGGFILPKTPDNMYVEYVLDGQQRITSLFAAHIGGQIQKIGEKKTTDYKNICVNLDDSVNEEEDAIISAEPTGESHLPLHDILNFDYDKFVILKEKGFTKEQTDKIDKYRKAFEGYDFSVIILNKDDINAAIEVFTRINTGGQTLTVFEIMVAKTYDEKKNFDMQEKWNEFIDELGDIGYETISSTIILQLLAFQLSETKECKRSVILNLDKQEIIGAWDNAIEALKKAIDFFRTHYGIPASKILPYDALLVPFGYFFLKKKEPNTQQREYLRDFFWRMSLSERYSGATESSLAQDIRRIDKIIAGEKPDYQGIQLRLDGEQALIDTPFSTGPSYCKAIMCILASKKPRNFHDDSEVILNNASLLKGNSRNYHHFFPKAYLKKKNTSNENSLMNITLISDYLNKKEIGVRDPNNYLTEFRNSNENFTRTMATHFINADSGWLDENDYEAFLRHRAKKIWAALKKKMLD